MDQTFRLHVPILKVDAEKRLIRGVATAEVLDSDGELVDYDAAKAAFQAWKGNIREMHQPKAVGKSVEIECDDDARAITVTAYISKGAQDTWEKVKDGTLSMFSIGGKARARTAEKLGDAIATRMFVGAIHELSVVDNGACPTADFSIVKMTATSDGGVERELPMEQQTTDDPTPATPIAPEPSAGGPPASDPPAADDAAKAVGPADVQKSGMEPYDISRVLSAIGTLEELMSSESWAAAWSQDPAVAAAELAQVALLKDAIALLIAFLKSEFEEQFKPAASADATPAAVSVEMATRATTALKAVEAVFTKAGARNSKSDAAVIQKMHDHSVSLGAACAAGEAAKAAAAAADVLKGADPAPVVPVDPPLPAVLDSVQIGEGEIQKMTAAIDATSQTAKALAAEVDTLKATTTAQAATIAKLTSDLATVLKQPMPGGPMLRAVPTQGVDKTLAGSAPADPSQGIRKAIDTIDDLLKTAKTDSERESLVTKKLALEMEAGIGQIPLRAR